MSDERSVSPMLMLCYMRHPWMFLSTFGKDMSYRPTWRMEIKKGLMRDLERPVLSDLLCGSVIVFRAGAPMKFKVSRRRHFLSILYYLRYSSLQSPVGTSVNEDWFLESAAVYGWAYNARHATAGDGFAAKLWM